MAIGDYEIPRPDEGPEPGTRWTLMFDGASNELGHGIGVVLTSPKNYHKPYIARLCFDYTNNIAKYEACILGLEATIDLRIKYLEVFRDSTLIIYQVKGEWDTKHPNFTPYQNHVLKLARNSPKLLSTTSREKKIKWPMLYNLVSHV